jgi:autotransporter-associated beta strand protein
MRRRPLGFAVAALVLAAALPAQAQTWSGAGVNSNWTTAANWVGGVAPASSATTAVTFPGGLVFSLTPILNVGQTVNSVNITGPGYSFSGSALSFAGTSPTLTVSQPGSVMDNPVNLAANVTLTNSHPFTLSGGLSGPSSLTKAGAGTLVVTGPTWHTGSTIVAAGTLQVGDGTDTPISVGPIVNAGDVVFDNTFVTVDVNGITGSGTLTVTAGSALRNTATLSHQGKTTVDGSLDLDGGIQSNGALVIGPSGAVFADVDGSVGSITGSTFSFLAIDFGTLTAGSDDSSTTYAGNFSGNGNFRKVGAGTFTLSGNNMVNGNVIVDAGTLRLGNGAGGPSNVQNITVHGTVEFDRGGGSIFVSSINGTGDAWIKPGTDLNHGGAAPLTHQGLTIIEGRLFGGFPSSIDNNGPVVVASTGRLDVNGTSTIGSLAGSGMVNVNQALTLGGDGTSTTFSGPYGGSGDLRKVGSGTFTFASNNVVDGDITVEAPGTLQIGNGATGPGILRALTINGTLLVDVPGTVHIQGLVSGTGNLRVQPGSTVFNAAGTPLSHQGSTIVNGFLESATPSLGIDNNGPVVVGPAGYLRTGNALVGSLAGFGTLEVQFGTFVAGGDNTSTTFAGTISGTGELRKTGSGTLTLATTTFFGGETIVEAPGALRLGDGSTGPASVGGFLVDGALLFNTPAISVSGTISGNGSVTVQTGSTVTHGASFPMTHAGTTIVSGQLNSPTIAAISNGSPLLLSGGVVTRGGAVGSLAGSGSLQLNAGGTFTTGGNNQATAFAGVLSGNGPMVKTGNGVFTLSGTSPSYTGSIQVATGTLHVSGSLATGGMTVVTGATLTGTGTINGPVNVEIGGNLAPGPTIGTITTGNLALAGNLLLEIQGPTPGTQHDRVNANGSVAINGATLTLSGAYVPLAGNAFTIIQNDGSDAVTGTFAGLPEGATLTFNGASMRITYVGGTGNDVILAPASFTVTPSAGSGGTIAPNTPQVVAPNATVAFTVTANPGYSASVGGTCGGNLVGTTYTTNPVIANCTVVASFTLTGHTVTPSAGPNGTIAPSTPQTVANGGTLSFTVTPDSGYTASVGGTCGGSLTGNTYTTNPVTADCTVSVTFELVNPPRLVNISTRMQVLTGDDVMIGGFVIGGSSNKTVAIVAYGPSLASFGISNPLANPTMTLVRSSDQTVVGTNNDWNTASNASQLQASGFAPSNNLESAILVNLAPGAYTAVVQGVGGGTGVGMVAIFEVDSVSVPLTNISTRGRVLTGNDVMIGGFIIQGQGPQTVAIVATGPSLASYGIASPLANPTLTLVRASDQAVLETNDDWGTGPNAAQLSAAGFAPSNSLESAIYVTLPPGAYTAILSGVGNTTGVGVIGVYRVP